ncbi:ribonuclease HI family protein [bacterium]|nr:ribonuclease HI family protein [bacterium]
MERLIINIDGACRGNPGPASYGVVVQDSSGRILKKLKGFIGTATNNIAEYSAFIQALKFIEANPVDSVEIRSDSELLVKQIKGLYKVKSPNLKGFYNSAIKLIKRIGPMKITHVPRSENQIADKLANEALDALTNQKPLF